MAELRIDLDKIAYALGGVTRPDGASDMTEESHASELEKEIYQRSQVIKGQMRSADAEVQLTLQRKALRRWFGVAGLCFVAVLVFAHLHAVRFFLTRYDGWITGAALGESSRLAASGLLIVIVVAPLASASFLLVTMIYTTFRPRRVTEFTDFGSIPGVIGKLAGKAKDAASD